MPQSTPRNPVSMTVRSTLWIVVSLAFLVQGFLRIHSYQQDGRPVTNWMVGQLVLWFVVLGFWTFAAWRDWKRRNEARKVV